MSIANRFPLASSLVNDGRKYRRTPRVSCGLLAVLLAMWMTMPGCRAVSTAQNAQGVRLYQQQNYQAALQKFQQAISSDPKDPDGYYNLAATMHRLGKLQGQKSMLDQAESYYNQAIDHNPDQVDAYRGLAVLLCEQGRSEDAFRMVEGWSDRSPTLAAPKVELARLFEEYGDRDAAKAHLLEALERDPYNARALAALGHIYEVQGNTAQALSVYQRSLAHNSVQPDVAARVASLQQAGAISGSSTTTLAAPPTTPPTTPPPTTILR